MYKTIMLGGQLCVGKDLVADYLAARLNEMCHTPWKRNAFANKVKETFERAFGKDRDFIEKWKRVDTPPPGFNKTIRQCLIAIGDGFRQMQPNLWIEQAFVNQDSHQIISDGRYVNETNFVRKQGGISILLWRRGYMNDIDNPSEQEYMPFIRKCLDSRSYLSNGDGNWHPFEGGIGPGMEIPFDLFIRNDGTIDDLKRKVDNIIIPCLRQRWADIFTSSPTEPLQCA